MTRLLISLATFILLTCPCAGGDNRKEAEAYARAASEATVEAFREFLRLYPESAFRESVEKSLDSSLYVSPIREHTAYEVLIPMLDEDSVAHSDYVKALPVRDGGRDFIIGTDTSTERMSTDSLTFFITEKIGNIWQIPESFRIPKIAAMQENGINSIYENGLEAVRLPDGVHIRLSYFNFSAERGKGEFVEMLIRLSDRKCSSAIFSGREIYGDKLEGLLLSRDPLADDAATGYLQKMILENRKLVSVSKEDAESDRIMAEWRDLNPDAVSSADKVIPVPFDESCSLAVSFARSRKKEHGEGYTAALTDFRGYTVICATNGDSYELVWCEPKCEDRTAGRYLHSIFFEYDSTLALFYYQGRKSFKYRIDLKTGKLAR